MTVLSIRLSVVRRCSGRALVLAAIAACGRPSAPLPATPAGPGYVLYYQDGAGVHRVDARTGVDTVLLSATRPGVASALSPDRSILAVGYSGADSARLVVVDVATGTTRQLHAAGRSYRYTLAWSPDGKRLAVGYFAERRAGGQTLPAAGNIVLVSLDGRVAAVGCGESRVVHAWAAADTIVVGDGRTAFAVDVRGCRGNSAMRLQGKRELTFSPDGKRLSYFVTAQARRGGRTVSATELHLARYDGTDARRVIGDPYDPQHARWSPDGSRIAFDVRPPNGPNLRHIAVFEVEGQRVRFFPSQTEEGTPRDANPFWAPTGAILVHDRVIAGRAEKVLRTLALDLSAVQTEPRVLMSGNPLGTVWGWLDETEMVVVSDQWVKLLTTDGTPIYELPGRKTVLGVAQMP